MRVSPRIPSRTPAATIETTSGSWKEAKRAHHFQPFSTFRKCWIEFPLKYCHWSRKNWVLRDKPCCSRFPAHILHTIPFSIGPCVSTTLYTTKVHGVVGV